MTRLPRRRFLARSSALAGSTLLPGPVFAQQRREVTFITPFGFLIGYAPTLNAQAGGHLAKEGLELNVLPGKGSAVAVQQVIVPAAGASSSKAEWMRIS